MEQPYSKKPAEAGFLLFSTNNVGLDGICQFEISL